MHVSLAILEVRLRDDFWRGGNLDKTQAARTQQEPAAFVAGVDTVDRRLPAVRRCLSSVGIGGISRLPLREKQHPSPDLA
jgi:hypothetical protein